MDHSGANGRSSIFFYFAVVDCNYVQWTLSTPPARFHNVWMFANDDMKVMVMMGMMMDDDDDDGDGDGNDDEYEDDDDDNDDEFGEL